MRKKRILPLLLGVALLAGGIPVYGEEAGAAKPAQPADSAGGGEEAGAMSLGVKELCEICDSAEGQEILELGEMPGLKAETRASMEKLISQITDEQYHISFLILDINTGQGYSKSPEEVYFGANTIAGPYAAALAEKLVDEGKLSLEAAVEKEPEEGGAESAEKGGTLRELLEETAASSGDTAYSTLREVYGADFFGKWLNGGNVETSYAGKQWPSYDARTLAKMWVSVYEYFQSGRGISGQVKTMFEHSEGSFITEALGEKYTVYARPGFSGETGNQGWHDAGIIMAGEHPYLMVVMTDIPWSESDDTHGKLLTELAGYLDEAHLEVFPVPTEAPQVTEPVSVSQVPEEEGGLPEIPAAVWIVLALAVAGGGFFAYRVRSIRRERELQKQQWEAAKRRRKNHE